MVLCYRGLGFCKGKFLPFFAISYGVLVYRGKKSKFLQGVRCILTLLSTRKIHADPCEFTFLSPVDEYLRADVKEFRD
jgi:hypothetical protein